MQHLKRSLDLPNLEQVLELNPLIVSPETSLSEVVAVMSQSQGSGCQLSEKDEPTPTTQQSSYALVVSEERLVGIFTERDLVKLAAKETYLSEIAIADVMTQPVVTLKRSQCFNILSVLAWLRQHSLRHLPILDEFDKIEGVITLSSIREALQPLNFLKLRRIKEVVTFEVIQALADDSVLHLAQLMTQRQVSCVVICQRIKTDENLQLPKPIGIVTERDIVQFQALGLSLSRTKAESVMSAPLFPIRLSDSLWFAHQQMQQHHIRRLVVTGERGQLAGIVTQTSLLKVLNQVEILNELEELHQAFDVQTLELKQTNQQLQNEIAEKDKLAAALREANSLLEQKVDSKTAKVIQINSALRKKAQEQQQSEVLLQKSQQQLNDFIDNAVVGMHWVGADGEILWANQAELNLLGYEREEYIGHNLAEFHADADVIEDILRRLNSQETLCNYEARLRCKDGSIRYVLISSNVLWEEGKFVHTRCFTQDITDRQQAELTLKQERNFTNAILDTVGVLIVVLNRQGRIIKFNRTCEQITGYTFEAVKDQEKWEFLILPEEKEIVQAVFERTLSGQFSPQYENYWLAKDGSRHLISWSNTALFDSQGEVEYVIVTGMDISEQRRTQVKLEHQYRQTHLLAEITRKIRMSIKLDDILQTTVREVQQLLACDRVMVVELRVNSTAVPISEAVLPDLPPMLNYQLTDPLLVGEYLARYRQGRILAINNIQTAAINPEIKQLLEQFAIQAKLVVPILSQDQLQGLLVAHQCTSPRQWQNSETEVLQQLADQIGVAISQAQLLDNLEERVLERTIELTTSNLRLETEIEERRQAEKLLGRSEKQLQLITDALPVLIAYIDNQQRYCYNNRNYETWFGKPCTELLGLHMKELLSTTHYQTALPYIEKVLSGHSVTFEAELINDRGNHRWVRPTYIPDIDSDGTVKGFFAMVDDITERKAVEQMKSEFVSIASHEMRTPLTSIHGVLKLLCADRLGNLSPSGREMTEIALRNTERLTRLVNDVLDLERMESGKETLERRKCDAAQLIQQAIETTATIAQQDQVIIEADLTPIEFWADGDRIIQTLINLLSNAIKFSPAKSQVSITSQLQDNQVLFTVKDRGRGVPADKLETIFERFQQVDASDSRKKGGTGLGLAICRHIVEQHGGKIWVESVCEQGSTFFFTVPQQ